MSCLSDNESLMAPLQTQVSSKLCAGVVLNFLNIFHMCTFACKSALKDCQKPH